jgi:hypothetical protein
MLSASHHRLSFALGIVLSLHLCILMIPFVFDSSKLTNNSSTLKLTLTRPVAHPVPSEAIPEIQAEAVQIEDVPVKEVKEVRELNTDIANKTPEESFMPESIEGNTGNEVDQTNTFNRARIITAVVNNIRESAAQTRLRGFSLEQWLPKTEPQYRR